MHYCIQALERGGAIFILWRAARRSSPRVVFFAYTQQFTPGMFAVTAQTAPGFVAVGRAGVNNNSRGVRGTTHGGVLVRGVGGSNVHRSRVAMGGAQRRGDAMRMVRTAATEGESTARRDTYYTTRKFRSSDLRPPRPSSAERRTQGASFTTSHRIVFFFLFLLFFFLLLVSPLRQTTTP